MLVCYLSSKWDSGAENDLHRDEHYTPRGFDRFLLADNALTRHAVVSYTRDTTRRHPPLRSDVVWIGLEQTQRLLGFHGDGTTDGGGKEPRRLRFTATDRVYLARNRPKRKMQTKREFYRSASGARRKRYQAKISRVRVV